MKMDASREQNSWARRDGVGPGIFHKQPCNTTF